MRKLILITAAVAAIGVSAAGVAPSAQAHNPGGYGGGMMGSYGGGYGPGYMMGGSTNAYGPGYMMNGYGAGDDDDQGYGRRPEYRGKRLCWKAPNGTRPGHYEPCAN